MAESGNHEQRAVQEPKTVHEQFVTDRQRRVSANLVRGGYLTGAAVLLADSFTQLLYGHTVTEYVVPQIQNVPEILHTMARHYSEAGAVNAATAAPIVTLGEMLARRIRGEKTS